MNDNIRRKDKSRDKEERDRKLKTSFVIYLLVK